MVNAGEPQVQEPRLSLDLPPEWEPIPIDPAAYSVWFRDLVAGPEISNSDRDHLEVAFRSVLVEARQEGLVMAAGYLDVIGAPRESGGAEGGGDLVAASLFAAVRGAGRLEGVLSSYAWQAALRESEREGDIKALKAPEIVMLGDFEAVKSVVMDELPADDRLPAVHQFAVTYYLTIGDGAAMLILGFRTPCIWLTDEFEALFGDIAATLEVDLG